MGQVNHPTTLIDQIIGLRREVDELRKKVGTGATLTGRSGELAVSADSGLDSGLVRSWIPVLFEKVRLADMPAVTSSSFETVWEANFAKSHPFIELYTVDGCDTGTTGAGQIVITDPVTGGTEVADSWVNGSGIGRAPRGPYTLPGDVDGPVRVAVQYRRTGGTGNVYAVVMDATQRQFR
jgi:hypothetical protein